MLSLSHSMNTHNLQYPRVGVVGVFKEILVKKTRLIR